MPPAVSYVTSGFAATDSAGRNVAMRVAVVALLHAAALGVLIWSELDLVSRTAFVLTWGFLNFCWLAALRRPATAAALSLTTLGALIVVWRLDSFRIRRRTAMLGAVSCFAGLASLSFAIPVHPFDEFLGANYVS